MRRKSLDMSVTGQEPNSRWQPDDSCPCGSGRPFARCCLRFDVRAYKLPVERRPSGSQPEFSHPRCYMHWTQDCNRQLSREHFISASVLGQVGSPILKVNGLPWLGPNETRTLSIRNLTSNILCKRHNEALSPLDAMAGKFFSAVRNVHDDVLNRRTLSRLGKWLFFSGEELEFWLLKTAVGLFHSGNVARDRAK